MQITLSSIRAQKMPDPKQTEERKSFFFLTFQKNAEDQEVLKI
jgi:hypothetical protein